MIMQRIRSKKREYYTISVYRTLFDEFLVEHHTGRKYRSASKKYYTANKKEALYHSIAIMMQKKITRFF